MYLSLNTVQEKSENLHIIYEFEDNVEDESVKASSVLCMLLDRICFGILQTVELYGSRPNQSLNIALGCSLFLFCCYYYNNPHRHSHGAWRHYAQSCQ